MVWDLGGQHRGQRGPQTGRGVCRDVTTRGIPGVRARGRLRHVIQVIGTALRARHSARPLDPQPPGPRGPEPRPAGERCGATPVAASRSLCSSLRGSGAALPAVRCSKPGPWGQGWVGGRDLVFVPDCVRSSLGPLALCAFQQASADFVGRSDRQQWGFRPLCWVTSRKAADPLPFSTFLGLGRSLPDTLPGRGGCPEQHRG